MQINKLKQTNKNEDKNVKQLKFINCDENDRKVDEFTIPPLAK